MEEIRECKDCEKLFVVSEGEKAWFQNKGWELPVRCKPCREKRKEKMNANNH